MVTVNNHEIMKRTKSRPKETGTPVMIRLQPDLLKEIDDFRRREPDLPNRPEAMRRLVEKALQQRHG
jgi:metal-responsive CopG/Arc/MetJ family transcriptional regulator